ncbi:Uncharacterised protein [Bordetella ansorpii]|uniref:Uncharacterized protein n=1 Tax=Bordetella ansorpii TaxID=288768 RepID=A0A157SRM7_9BORD|nr:Uncharacterised protein [Bordetella ansorpii]
MIFSSYEILATVAVAFLAGAVWALNTKRRGGIFCE